MYKDFYKLLIDPFEITPDPSFLFVTRRHQEALIALYYGVQRRKGFMALTGDIDTGKTLLIRCLLRMVKDSDDPKRFKALGTEVANGCQVLGRAGTAAERRERELRAPMNLVYVFRPLDTDLSCLWL
jgi:hypothetical protein